MSALVIDTSSWIEYFASGAGEDLIEPALDEGRVFLPPVVAAELLSGRLSERERSALEDLLGTVPLCGTDLGHWFRVGRLRSNLGAKGLTVSTPDAHVAQCAIDLTADLLAEDAIYGQIARHTPMRLAARR